MSATAAAARRGGVDGGGRAAKKPFLVTLDTEGDDLWSSPREITCRNARFLPRFQALCERYGFRPTYLTNYEMACDPAFVELAKDAVARGAAEVGMHLHAWNSPPLTPLSPDDLRAQPYLVEYPTDVLRAKVEYMTKLLEDTFACRMVSHRAGRWALDVRYVEVLAELGYEVDCSVTPHVSWRSSRGAFAGGTDYRDFPEEPYVFDAGSLRGPRARLREPAGDADPAAKRRLMELPVTVRPRFGALGALPALAALAPVDWLRPNGKNGDRLVALAARIAASESPYAQFMLHSSELMPGGSPRFPSERSIERLYDDLTRLFESMEPAYVGETLASHRRAYA